MASVRYVVLMCCLLMLSDLGGSLSVRNGWKPSKPKVAKEFFSNIVMFQGLPHGNVTYAGNLWYDEDHSRSAMEYKTSYLGYSVAVQVYQYDNTGFTLFNGVCRNSTAGFQSLFDWVDNATYIGKVKINGNDTDEWQLQSRGSINFTFTLFASGNVPVRLVQLQQFISTAVTTIFDFTNFSPQILPNSTFVPPKACFGIGFVCSNGSIETLELYRFHPISDWVWSNRNFADLIGDTEYLCFAGNSGEDQLITQLVMRVNTSWGQYALCNNNECVGLNLFNVGREATLGLENDNGGQCTPNTVLGSWFSFPAAGECLDDSTMENCSWRFEKVLKTISVTCLTNLSFFEACKLDTGFPFPKASHIFSNAFRYEDPSQGGCPSLKQPPYSFKPISSTSHRTPSRSYPFTITHGFNMKI